MGKNKAAINIGKSCRVAHSGRLSNQEKYLATADVLRPRILHRGLYRPADIYSKGVRSSWISVKETSGVRAGMPLLLLSQAPTVCTSFGRWFRAALSPLLLGFQSVPLAFHHWDRHLVISCIPEQASIASPPRHPTRRTNRTLKNGLDMVPPPVFFCLTGYTTVSRQILMYEHAALGKSTNSAPVPRRLTGVDGHLFLAFRLFCKHG